MDPLGAERPWDMDVLDQYEDWLRGVAVRLRKTERVSGVDDLVQEGWIAMWNALHSYDPLKGPLDYWLKYKAKMAMLHFLKPKEYLDGGGKEVPTSEFVEHEGFYEEDLILAYHYGEIHEAVDRLPLRQKTVVYQRYWLDWKKPDFIEHYGYDPSSDLSRAKKSLRGELAHLAGAA